MDCEIQKELLVLILRSVGGLATEMLLTCLLINFPWCYITLVISAHLWMSTVNPLSHIRTVTFVIILISSPCQLNFVQI